MSVSSKENELLAVSTILFWNCFCPSRGSKPRSSKLEVVFKRIFCFKFCTEIYSTFVTLLDICVARCFIYMYLSCNDSIYPQALEFRTPLFPHLVPPAIMVWIFVWKYIFEPFIHILQHFVLQLSRSTNFCF